MGHVGMGWVGSYRDGVGSEKFSLNNLICYKLGVLCIFF